MLSSFFYAHIAHIFLSDIDRTIKTLWRQPGIAAMIIRTISREYARAI